MEVLGVDGTGNRRPLMFDNGGLQGAHLQHPMGTLIQDDEGGIGAHATVRELA